LETLDLNFVAHIRHNIIQNTSDLLPIDSEIMMCKIFSYSQICVKTLQDVYAFVFIYT